MKKSILSIVAGIFMSVPIFAQIPNGSFENWTNTGTYNNPDNWDNLNSMTSMMGVYTCTKGTGGASGGGSSYIKLVSKNVSGMGVMPGVAVSGTLNSMNYTASSGFPYTGQPQSLTGSWQYMAYNNDAGYIAVYLTKWNAGMMMRDTVASVVYDLHSMVMSWATFSIDLNYLSSEIPDTAMIILSSSGVAPSANSYLYVDNLAFSGSVAGIKNQSPEIISLMTYPNPVKEYVFLNVDIKEKADVSVQLTDVEGRIIKETMDKSFSGKYSKIISTEDIDKGIYFIKVYVNDAVKVEKIIIE